MLTCLEKEYSNINLSVFLYFFLCFSVTQFLSFQDSNVLISQAILIEIEAPIRFRRE